MTEVMDTAPLSRREKQKEARRLELIDAALAVFSRVGFAAAKMDDVADEAGVSKGTVYLYFDSKEQLFEGVVKAKMLPAFESAAEMLIDLNAPAADRLKTFFRFFYKKVLDTDRRQIMRLIISEGPNFPHLAEFYHTTILSRGHAILNAIIQHGIETGEFRQLSGQSLMHNVVAGALVAGLWKMVFDPFQPIDLDDYFDTHLDLILNGLSVAHPQD